MIKAMIKDQKVDLVCLQETKKEPWRRKMFRLGGHQLERSL